MNEELEKVKKAGSIASQVRDFARSYIKKGQLLREIAETIESKIEELGAKPAFPVTLSIDEIAAHATPSFNDEETAKGLVKVDFGCHISGFIADTAFTIDLEDSDENKNLIRAAETALEKAISIFSEDITISDLGKEISETAASFNCVTIKNLSGHSIEPFNVHAGITIPNFENSSDLSLPSGLYAIEPFTTLGSGAVRDGKLSGIYHLESLKPVRDPTARKVLDFIKKEYNTLPFCSRWIHKKFGSRGLLALRFLEKEKVLHHYPQLIESSGSKVAQAEHTVFLNGKEKIVTTL